MTPLGMSREVEATPVSPLEMAKIKSGAIPYDVIYTPSPTRFLSLAEQQGAIAIDGLEMLARQGAAALEIWLGREIPIDVMRQSLQEYLSGTIKGI